MNRETANRWVEAMEQRRAVIRYDGFDPCPDEVWSIPYNEFWFVEALRNVRDFSTPDNAPFWQFLHVGPERPL